MTSRERIARERIAFLEARLTAVTGWLEANKPEVFREGIWAAIYAADERFRTRGPEPGPLARAGEPVPGTHLRPGTDTWCAYLHDGTHCNKCGFTKAPVESEEGARYVVTNGDVVLRHFVLDYGDASEWVEHYVSIGYDRSQLRIEPVGTARVEECVKRDIRVVMDAAYQVGVHPPGKVLGAIDRLDMWLRAPTDEGGSESGHVFTDFDYCDRCGAYAVGTPKKCLRTDEGGSDG